jgi:hypothetical protein
VATDRRIRILEGALEEWALEGPDRGPELLLRIMRSRGLGVFLARRANPSPAELGEVRETTSSRHSARSATLRGRAAVEPDPCLDCGSRTLVEDSEGAWFVLCYVTGADPVRETVCDDDDDENHGPPGPDFTGGR